jgi:hypothetical protein
MVKSAVVDCLCSWFVVGHYETKLEFEEIGFFTFLAENCEAMADGSAGGLMHGAWNEDRRDHRIASVDQRLAESMDSKVHMKARNFQGMLEQLECDSVA